VFIIVLTMEPRKDKGAEASSRIELAAWWRDSCGHRYGWQAKLITKAKWVHTWFLRWA